MNPINPSQGELWGSGTGKLPVNQTTGWLVKAVSVEGSGTKAGNGDWFLEYKLEIIEGEHAGKTGSVRFMQQCQSNPDSVKYAETKLRTMAVVCGQYGPFNDEHILLNRPHRVLVKEQENDKKYTEVYGWLGPNGENPEDMRRNGASAGQPQPQGAPAFAQPSQQGVPPFAQPQPQQMPNFAQPQQPQAAPPFAQPQPPQPGGMPAFLQPGAMPPQQQKQW